MESHMISVIHFLNLKTDFAIFHIKQLYLLPGFHLYSSIHNIIQRSVSQYIFSAIILCLAIILMIKYKLTNCNKVIAINIFMSGSALPSHVTCACRFQVIGVPIYPHKPEWTTSYKTLILESNAEPPWWRSDKLTTTPQRWSERKITKNKVKNMIWRWAYKRYRLC